MALKSPFSRYSPHRWPTRAIARCLRVAGRWNKAARRAMTLTYLVKPVTVNI